ncbi:MAG: PilT/PilU family type 4a pilus ATPase [Candidatus Hydrogenedentes bacterium]|nr:PilT/PilU family type 4a pilus ATPase [Candidatus Hydrogenedentota bacterium]
MAEWILGVGNQKSIRDIIALCEKELVEKEGLPRKIVARAPSIEITAERDEFESEFERYKVKANVKGRALELMQTLAKDCGDLCSLTEEEGCWTLVLPVDGKKDPDKVKETVDKFHTSIPLPEVWRLHGEKYRLDHISTELLFQAMVEYKASDVHVSPGYPPVFRVDGEMRTSDLLGKLSSAQINALIREVASDRDWQDFQENRQASFNFHQVGLGYSRVSCFIKAGAPHCTFRFLPERIPSFEELRIPTELMEQLSTMHHGLVLLTGMTGSGKSTTVAAMVDYINSNHTSHILTIENPVEYVHHNKKSVVSQRNTGSDTPSFFSAVTGALRHDPDVIVIGEMRDADTIRSAISAAATGHLVISTLHSNTASEVVNRVVSFFDPVERDLVKLQLRDCVRCIICQRLVPKIGGGRIPTIEVLFNDIKPINDSILEGNTDAIRVGMQQTVSHSWLFENYLFKLYKQGIITLEMAHTYATDVSILDQMLMGTYSVPRLDSIKHLGAH